MKNLIIIIITVLISNFSFAQPTSGGYCTATGTFYNQPCFNPWSTNDMIDNFWTTGGISDISNLLSGCSTSGIDNYSDFTGNVLVTSPSAVITLNIQGAVNGSNGECLQGSGGCYAQGFAVWIDWNQDLDFNDPGEKVFESPSSGHQVFTGTFTVPSYVLCDDYRMRARAVYATAGANILPCSNVTYGEIEDYTITVNNCSSQERTICQGETATIDYSAMLPPTAPITVLVSPMTNVTISIPTIDFNPLDTTIYLVTWTSPDSSWQDTAKINVNVPLLPTYAGLDDTVCAGSLVQLNPTLGNTTTTFLWGFNYPPGINNGFFMLPNNTVFNPDIVASIPGIYPVIFTEIDTNYVCPNVTDTALITFSEGNHVTTLLDPSCFGYADGSITITPTGTIGASSYSIDNGVTFSSSNTFTGLAAGTYNVVSSDVAGCTYTNTVTLVDPLEVIMTVSPDVTVCENGMTTMTANAINGFFFNYNWDFTADLSANQNLSPIADSTVTVYATNQNNCSSDTLSITVSVRPPIYLNITENDSVCPGNNSLITVSAQGGNNVYSYSWEANGDPMTLTSSSIGVNPTENTTYCVTVADGCESTPKTICTDVIMRGVPVPTFTSDIIDGCVPITVMFTNTTNPHSDTANWVIDGQSYINSGVISHTFHSVGIYDIYLDVHSEYGCYDDTIVGDYIETYPIPNAKFFVSPDPATIFNPIVDMINLTTGEIAEYIWTLPAGTPSSSNEMEPTVVYPDGQPNDYLASLKVISDHSCIDSVSNLVHVISDVNIYAPNIFTPDHNNINKTWRVYIEGIDIYDYHLQIYNRWGEIVWESFDSEAEWNGTFANGEPVLNGTYVWVLRAKDQTYDKHHVYRGTINLLR